MPDRFQNARILIYSHDSFGLGHLRRCRAIAHSLVDRFKGLSVLILSGSPIVGSFDYRARVDFVRIPGVIKHHNGEYTSLSLHIDVEQTLAIRSAIIRQTAEVFAPDLCLVDKEPLGLMGEMRETLAMLKHRGTRLALGLRDVMDDGTMLAREWERKRVLPALKELYDDIWIYGLGEIWQTLEGIELPEDVRRKIVYTGYLPRTVGPAQGVRSQAVPDEPFILVTPGGGGDGIDMIDWVISAYEQDPNIPYHALVVTGPFMPSTRQQDFVNRAAVLDKVHTMTFDAHIETLMKEAVGIVAMGGYNTFCEILSLDKPALLVPRSVPRREQLIRARRASEIGLVRMLDGDGPRDPAEMAEALRVLPDQKRPSSVAIPGLLGGLDTVTRLVKEAVEEQHKRQDVLPARVHWA
ncbi:MAG: glycosyltransferase [Rhodovibrionaceae bacterium]|nr:glycosyltransferase [Rhodovibrionaceae bacterium]